eukprot:TRINITY_DN1022_c0_g1_i2.p1 TRINITY_DN1022_c0_g1~~TRINITY_DN1022_c0_g1_i2.p1  ORF type:complete len:1383 (+),score=256.46 TRINITY_DN1022_c0_g1_i2:26-4174(+)
MDIRQTSIIEIDNVHSHVQCAAFHPIEPLIYVVIGNNIYVANTLTGAVLPPIVVQSEASITSLFISSTTPLCISYIEEDTLLQAWDVSERALHQSISLSRYLDKKKTLLGDMSRVSSQFFFAAVGTSRIYVLDIITGNVVSKIDTKRAITTLNLHPTKDLIICSHNDGTVKLYTPAGNMVSSCNDIPSKEAEKGNEHTTIGCVAIHPTYDILAAATVSGRIAVWNIDPKTTTKPASFQKMTSDILSIYFHPSLPILVTMDGYGLLMFWRFFVRDGSCAIEFINFCERLKNLNEPQPLKIKNLYSHSAYNLISFKSDSTVLHPQMMNSPGLGCMNTNGSTERSTARKAFKICFYSLEYERDSKHLISPFVIKEQHAPGFYSSPLVHQGSPTIFVYPNETFFLSQSKLMTYSFAHNTYSVIKKFPEIESSCPIDPFKLLYSKFNNILLVFFEVWVESTGSFNTSFSVLSQDKEDRELALISGRDAAFIGEKEEEIIYLSSDGTTVFTSDVQFAMMGKSGKQTKLPFQIDSIWRTPLDSGYVVLMHDSKNNRIFYGYIDKNKKSEFVVDTKSVLSFSASERIIQVSWIQQSTLHKSSPSSENVHQTTLFAVLTTTSVYIIRSDFTVMATHNFYPDHRGYPPVTSCYWIGYTLLCTTPTHLMYITLKGTLYPLVSLDVPRALILQVLNDRVVFASNEYQTVKISVQAIGLLEPLLMGFTHAVGFLSYLRGVKRSEIENYMRVTARCYDSRRFGIQLLQELDVASYSNLALALTRYNDHICARDPWLRFRLALRSLQFRTAYQLLLLRFLQEFPELMPYIDHLQGSPQSILEKIDELPQIRLSYSSDLYNYSRHMIIISTHYAQFESAFMTAVLLGDGFAMLEISSVTRSESIMRKLVNIIGSSHNHITIDGLDQESRNALKIIAQQKLDEWGVKSLHVTSDDFTSDNQNNNTKRPTVITSTSSTAYMSYDSPAIMRNIQVLFSPATPTFSNIPSAVSGTISDSTYVEGTMLRDWPIQTSNSNKTSMKYMSSKGWLTSPKLNVDMYTMGTKHGNSGWLPIPLIDLIHSSSGWRSIPAESFDIPELLAKIKRDEEADLQFLKSMENSESDTSTSTSTTSTYPTSPKSVLLHEKSYSQSGMAVTSTPTGSSSGQKKLKHHGRANASEYMRKGLLKLEQANYTSALDQFSTSLHVMLGRSGSLSSSSTSTTAASAPSSSYLNPVHVKFCVMYIFLTNVMIDIIQSVTATPQDLAIASAVLANLPLQPKHRLVCLRMAIQNNYNVQNYGVAAHFLEKLLDKELPDHKKLVEMYSFCTEKQQQQQHDNIDDGSFDPKQVKLSYDSLKPIQSPYLECSLCSACYQSTGGSGSSSSVTSTCVWCKNTTLNVVSN